MVGFGEELVPVFLLDHPFGAWGEDLGGFAGGNFHAGGEGFLKMRFA